MGVLYHVRALVFLLLICSALKTFGVMELSVYKYQQLPLWSCGFGTCLSCICGLSHIFVDRFLTWTGWRANVLHAVQA